MKNSSKKILLVHSSNDLYGASKILILLIEILIEKGYDIHLILPENGPLNDNVFIKKTNVTIIKLGVFRKKYFNFFGLINRLICICKSTYFIYFYIKKQQINIVYTNTSTIISSTISSFLARTPSIYHVHEIPNSSFYYSKFISFIMNNFSSKVIVVSKSVRDYWEKIGLKKNKIELIYNGLYLRKHKLKNVKNSKLTFINVSRIIPYKGHHFLIDLFKKLSEKRKDLILKIYGDTLPSYDNYFKSLKNKVEEYGVYDKIIFEGFCNDIQSKLDNSDFFIHTPIHPDPLPTVIFEAIQNKIPVISTNRGGAVEILNNGKNGLLIEPDNLEISVNRIFNYINNKSLQKLHVKNSYEFIKINFNYNNFKEKILSVVELLNTERL